MGITIQNDTLTLSEIESQFKNEWILVENPVFDTMDKLVSGKVLFHSKNRDEVYAKDMALRPVSAAFLYTGPTPENIFLNI